MRINYAAIMAVLLLFSTSTLFAQNEGKNGKGKKQPPIIKPAKQGLKWTGLPLIAFNNDDGFGLGLGVWATYYDKGFAPYKWQIFGQLFRTSKKKEVHLIKGDFLKVGGTSIRVKAEAGYQRTQKAQYYGYGNYQDMPLNQAIVEGKTPINENIPAIADVGQSKQFKENIAVNKNLGINPGRRYIRERQNAYFFYDRVEPFANVGAESFFGRTNWKWITKFQTVRYSIDSYYGDYDDGEAEANSKTLIDLEQPTGYDATEGAKLLNIVRAGLIYDSRPRIREKDPDSGIFADVHLSSSGKGTGSDYSFQKMTLTWRQYIELFGSTLRPMKKRFVLAYRLMGQKTYGDAPFFELGTVYSADSNSAQGIGGSYGVRGYNSNQFVDKVQAFGNVEGRFTFAKSKGGMEWVALGFFDTGRVAPKIDELDGKGWHRAYGGGIRLVWQINTVINISVGKSKHSGFTNFSFGHMF